MGNPSELARARRIANEANATLDQIERLPRRKGSLVLWPNGVVWRRLGDDRWEPLHSDNGYQSKIDVYGAFPSDHVATCARGWSLWTHIKQLPGEAIE